jgi:parallel beta-helix repeat protein
VIKRTLARVAVTSAAVPIHGRRSRSTGEGVIRRVLSGLLLAGLLTTVFGVRSAAAAAPTGVTCGDTITAPGHYFLTADCTGAGITIAASDVHLMLNGHTMTNSCGCNIGVLGNGVSRLHIEGPGTITRYDTGIALYAVNDSRLENVTGTRNNLGLVLGAYDTSLSSNNDDLKNDSFSSNGDGVIQGSGSNNHYDQVTASNNNVDGLVLSNNSYATHVDGSTANGNSEFGISIDTGATGNKVDHNTALNNGVDDLADGNPGCDSNTWRGNNFGTASQPSCIN